MRPTVKNERGMSLVEVTIILMVLSILTAVIAPSVGDYINEARLTKAKEDVEVLGTGIVRLVRDTNGRCVKILGSATCTLANRVSILYSAGPAVAPGDLAATATDYTEPSAGDLGAVDIDNWSDDDDANQTDTFDSQLLLNTPNYDTPNEGTPTGYNRGGPAVVGVGWRGAYVASVEDDPWGKRYLANVVFLAVATNATSGTLEGNKSGGWSRDAIVISGGANGTFDTPFGGSTNAGTSRLSDDIIYVISGDTR
jgi:type II secretory pathway pseudopilin PulG